LDLAPEGLAQRAVEVREELDDGLAGLHAADVEPLAREVFDEGLLARVGDHAFDLRSQHVWLVQAVGRAELDVLLVRDAAPEEERQPRRELEIADAVRLAGRDIVWLELTAVDELGFREDALDDGFDAVVEQAALLAPRGEELHHRRDVGLGRRAPE